MVNENGKIPADVQDFEQKCELYLLGELRDSEQEEFEAAYFADDTLFERYLAVKDELLDSYARGELPPEKLARLAERFEATPPRRRQLQETKDFIQAITNAATGTVSAEDAAAKTDLPVVESGSLGQRLRDLFRFPQLVRIGALAALLILIGGVIWLVVRNREPESASTEQPVSNVTPVDQIGRQPEPVNQQPGQTNQQPTATMTPVERNQNIPSKPVPGNTNQLSNVAANSADSNQSPANANTTPEPTPVKPNKVPTQAPAPQIATLLLTPVATRNIGRANTLQIGPKTTSVRLTLVFRSDDYRSYSVSVATVGGGTVFSQKGLRVGGEATKNITLQMSSTVLRQQDYIVTVKGQTGAQTEVVAEYYFRVARK